MKRLLFPLLVAIFTAVQTFAYEITVLSSNSEYGFVDIQECTSCDEENTYILFAVPTDEYHYQFGGWEDGNKDNPRTVTLTEDATFTAIFGTIPSVRITGVTNPICTSATGEISVTVNNGVEPYTYVWNDGKFDNPRTNMVAGVYTLTVMDALGYSSIPMSINLDANEESAPVVNAEPGMPLPICDMSNGVIYAEVISNAENPDYTFSWKAPSETLFLDFESSNQTISGGTPVLQISHNYAYPNSFSNFEELQSDDQGALGSEHSAHVAISRDTIANFQVSIPTNIDISKVAGVSFYHKGTPLKFTITYGDGGTLWTKKYEYIPYSYNWQKITIPWSSLLFAKNPIRSFVFMTNNDNDKNEFWIDQVSLLSFDEESIVLSEEDILENVPSGLYLLTVTNKNDECVGYNKVFLPKEEYFFKPVIEMTATNPICEAENGEITVSVSNVVEPCTYEWADGSTDPNRQNLPAGEYILTVTDAQTCATTDTIRLVKDYGTLPQISFDAKDPICTTENGEITANINQGAEPYTYQWYSSSWQRFINFEDGLRTFSQAKSEWSTWGGGTEIEGSGVVEGGVNNTNHSLKIVGKYIPLNFFGVDNVTYTAPIKGGMPYLYTAWGISFYHKGDGCSFKVDDSVYALVPAHSEWTRVVVLWDSPLKLSSSGIEDPQAFHWAYRHGVNGYKESIEFYLDEIQVLFNSPKEETSTTLSALRQGTYSIIVDDSYGCRALDTITLKIDESTKPLITKTVTQAFCGHEVGEINLSYENGNEPVTATWDDDDEITTLERSEVQPGKYKITLTDSYGCEASDSTEIVVESFKYQPEIALVTVSQETSANLVVWQKEDTKAIDFYSIYRGTSSANVYEKIDDVPFSQTSIYLDENTDSKTKVYRYKISATDYCGQESPLSKNHKTINAMANRALQQDVVNIFWDGYEGFEFSTYSIYRITADDKKPIEPIDQVPSTDWTYADWNAPENTLAYYVAVELPKVIDVNEPFQKAESGPFVMAISNIAEVDNNLAVSDIKNTANVYSSHKTIVVENAGENQIVICNAIGQTIVRANGQNEVKKSFAVESGVYIVIVGSKAVKVVVE
ncbi:MAG: SprB repeat-containing protein [Bacteroidales bacterium]|nr:SprB repeat-containing protein [Bacteroidales bacterium]